MSYTFGRVLLYFRRLNVLGRVPLYFRGLDVLGRVPLYCRGLMFLYYRKLSLYYREKICCVSGSQSKTLLLARLESCLWLC